MNAFESPPSEDGGLSYIEQLHAASILGCLKPNLPIMLGADETAKTALLIKPTCKQWNCAPCAARNAKRWVARVIEGCNRLDGDWSMVTLTCPDYVRGAATVARLRQGWRKVYMRIRRQFGGQHYVRAWELHKDGESFHLHALFDVFPCLTRHYGTKSESRWLKDTAKACGLGYMAETHRVDNAGMVAGYICKYFLKSEGVLKDYPDAWPKNLRRIECSRSWVAWREKQLSDFEWELASGELYATWWSESKRRQGYRVTKLY